MNFSYNILAIYLLYLYFINIFLPSVYIIFPILIISKKHIYCKIIYVFVFYHLYTYLFVNNKKDSVNRVNERTGIRTPDTRLRRALLYPAELCTHIIWSGKRDSNSRLRPWQGRALPLNYSRLLKWRPGRGSNPRPPA